MKVKIIKACVADWYKDSIGRIFDVCLDDDKYYLEDDREKFFRRFINRTDCSIVGEEDEKVSLTVLDSIIKRLDKIEAKLNGIEKQKEVVKETVVKEEPKFKKGDLVLVSDGRDVWHISFYAFMDHYGKYYCSSSQEVSSNPHQNVLWKYCKKYKPSPFNEFVPKKYKWYAVDANGKGWFYVNKPEIVLNSWKVPHGDTMYEEAGFDDASDWKNSRVEREDEE